MKLVGPTPEELKLVSDGAAYALVLPQITEDIGRMIKAVQNQVFTAILHKNLTPEMAYQAWMEVYSHNKLLKSMETRVKVGTSTADDIAPHMNITIGDDNGKS